MLTHPAFQQEHICNIVSNLEASATTGKVLIGADFNDINIPSGESIIGFLESAGTLNAGFCTETTINMTDVVRTDVTHIMGTGGLDIFSDAGAGNPSFGQPGYVVASVRLDTAVETPLSGSRSFSIDNLGGVSLRSAGSAETLSVGYARIEPSAGSAAPSGVAIFGFTQNGVLVSEAGVPASALIQEGRIFAEVNGPVNTGIAIANPNDGAVTIWFVFTDTDGIDYGNGSFTLGPGEQLAEFLDGDIFQGGSEVSGAFTFTSNLPISVIALRGYTNDRNEFLMTTLPVASLTPATEDTIYLPRFVDGDGWSSQVVLVNPTNQTISGTVHFLGPGSDTSAAGPATVSLTDGRIGSRFTYEIPHRTSTVLQTSNAATLMDGSVQVVRDSGSSSASAVLLFSLEVGGDVLTEAGVPSSPASTAFRLYTETSGAPGAIGSIRSGVAITNTSSSEATVTLELITLDGLSTGLTAEETVPGSGHITKFVDDLFPGLSTPFQGILRISSPSAPIAVVSLRIRINEQAKLLMMTTPPSDETASTTTDVLLFPHIVEGQGWTTQFILFSGRAGQTSSGRLSFIDQTGQALDLSVN